MWSFFFRRHLSLSCRICKFLGLLIPHVTLALQSCISRWLVEACLYLIMSVPKLVISRLISSYLRWSQELNWVYLHLLVLSCLLEYVICAVWSAASVKKTCCCFWNFMNKYILLNMFRKMSNLVPNVLISLFFLNVHFFEIRNSTLKCCSEKIFATLTVFAINNN